MRPFNLSIITINLNNAAGLEKTIQSVISQSYNGIEFIIIDGASNDDSVEVIKKHESDINYWISEKDTGVFNAMNKGINNSNGKFLLFLNSGDVLNGSNSLDDFIQHQNFKGDIIYGDYKFDNGEKIYPDHLTPYYFMRTSLPHQSTLFKRSIFDTFGMYDEKYRFGADRAFYIKSFMSGEIDFQHINYPLTLYDLTGISNDPKLLKIKKEEDEVIFREYFGDHYDDLCIMREEERIRNIANRNNFAGILKRIKKRLFFLN